MFSRCLVIASTLANTESAIMEGLGAKIHVAGMMVTAAAMDPNLVSGHPFHVQDIVEAVRDGREPAVGPVEAMKALKIILAVYESAKNGGREVVID